MTSDKLCGATMFEQLIVLGQIPGTTIQINFMQVLVMGISVGLVLYVQHEVRRDVTDKQQ